MKNRNNCIFGLLIVALMVVAPLASRAQTSGVSGVEPKQKEYKTTLKWNALYWAVGVINMSVETKIDKHFTFNGDLVFSPWAEIAGRPYLGGQAIAEFRYYPKVAFRGFYVGVYGAFDQYRVSKWDHPATDVQEGIGMSYGLTLGYQLPIGKRWSIDFYLAGGWHLGWYIGYDTLNGGRYADWNKSGEWIPYKAGVAFSFKL
ncbi:MAG: DUF3575 domain-containing protein [Mucinivorans sp.]